MAGIERLTITLPSGMAEAVKGAVNDGDYASTSEVVRDALRDWKLKRALQLQEVSRHLRRRSKKVWRKSQPAASRISTATGSLNEGESY